MDNKLKNRICSILRRAWLRDKERNEAKKAARIRRNTYVCKDCKKEFPNKKVQVDHINPVVCPIKGWQGFNKYVERLFVPKHKLQVLCTDCHNTKSTKENAQRTKT